MSLEEASLVSQIVSAVAVIASLLFVGVQLRQNARQLRNSLNQSRMEQTNESFAAAGCADAAGVVAKGYAADPSTTDAEATQFIFLVTRVVQAWEEEFRARREGGLDDSRWRTTRANMLSLLRHPGGRAAWQMLKGMCAPDFVAEVDRIAEKARLMPPATIAGMWRAAVADVQARDRATGASQRLRQEAELRGSALREPRAAG